MSVIGQIATGFFNNLTNKEEDLFNERIKLCRSCKLLKEDKIFGEICNSDLYIDPKSGETSTTKKQGFSNRCGCVLRSKTRVKNAHCPIARW